MVDLKDADLKTLSDIMKQLDAAAGKSEEKKAIMEKLVEFFRETGLKSYKTDDLVIRFVDERKTLQFDSDLLQTKYPEIYKECHSVKVRKANVNIKRIVKGVVTEEKSEEAEPAEEGK